MAMEIGESFSVYGLNGFVESLLGRGGQGEVFKANYQGNEVALKWYFPSSSTSKQYSIIKDLCLRGSPSEHFLWPEGLATSENSSEFGYIMKLRPKNYYSISDLLNARINPSLKILARFGFELSSAFSELHRSGLCYYDISDKNAFFDENTGNALVCDNDNVSVSGSGNSAVQGTPRYMAPEVVLGGTPNEYSDRFSLGVLLFQIFMMHHPLHGEMEHKIHVLNIKAMQKLYGEDPVFIFNPKDKRNQPVKGFQDQVCLFWNFYPQYIRDVFLKLFCEGIKSPLIRPLEVEWMKVFARLYDHIFVCSCGAEYIYNPENIYMGNCERCKIYIKVPSRMRCVDGNVLLLSKGSFIYEHHIDKHRLPSFEKPIGEVVVHPVKRTLGIRNLSDHEWSFLAVGFDRKPLPKENTVEIQDGMLLDCGAGDFKIKV